MFSSEQLGGVREAEGSFVSAGKRVAVEEFEPAGGATRPAVLVLHGAGGLAGAGWAYRETARALARGGYRALLVHYFGKRGAGYHPAEINPVDFLGWMNTVGRAVEYAGRQQATEARVGLLGVSLGAYLALSVATQEPRVGAVVACSGGLPDAFAQGLRRMPPTLVLHGESDPVVPVEEAYKLGRLLREVSPESEVKVYPGQGHVLGLAATLDALGRAVAFFGRHLGDKKKAA